ncbi:CBS domain-containing protein [Xanthomonadaceae bacterium JHOS43]|nr:CBS domain-containing protein [Xanthomonadaceae bacterium JHOS43]MCX7563416.1 CBS domain-containing protein [Xanthomonadaceae bacterium XH05]
MRNAGHLLQDKGRAIFHVAPDDSVLDAIREMAQHGIGAVLVMKGDALVGILSERDYARNVILKDRSSKTTKVAEIMSAPVITVTPSSTLDDCMRTITDSRVRHLPVVDDGMVVGVLSIGDLVKAVIDAQAREIEQLHNYIAG